MKWESTDQVWRFLAKNLGIWDYEKQSVKEDDDFDIGIDNSVLYKIITLSLVNHDLIREVQMLKLQNEQLKQTHPKIVMTFGDCNLKNTGNLLGLIKAMTLGADNKKQLDPKESDDYIESSSFTKVDKVWWVESDFDNSELSMNYHIKSISDKFFSLEVAKRPVRVYMKPNGTRLFLGESLIAKGLPICFVKDRDAIPSD